MTTPFEKIALVDVPRMIGQVVHVSWARSGAHWRLERVEDGRALLRAPVSGKTLIVDVDELRYTRAQSLARALTSDEANGR